MEFTEGFICITNSNWNKTLSSSNNSFACVWLRRKTFKAISNGNPIFFVEKKSRLLRGYGLFNRFEVNSTKNCWEKYGIANGATNFEEFLSQLNFLNDESSWNKEIGNIIIKDLKWISQEVHIPIHDTNVNFHKAIVSGKKINSKEIEILLSYFN